MFAVCGVCGVLLLSSVCCVWYVVFAACLVFVYMFRVGNHWWINFTGLFLNPFGAMIEIRNVIACAMLVIINCLQADANEPSAFVHHLSTVPSLKFFFR